MSRIDLVEPWIIRQMRRQVKESMQAHGEEVIIFPLYHASVDRDAPRCPNCYDDIYSNSGQAHCPVCYGTGFEGAYKGKYRGWALLGVTDQAEQKRNRGEYMPTDGSVNFEGLPVLAENDIFVRVRSWSQDHRPLDIEGIYRIDQVRVDSLRTGNVFAQLPSASVGQRSNYIRLDDNSPFYQMLSDGTLSDQYRVERYDGEQR